MDYLGNIKMIVYFNEQYFDQNSFGQSAVQRRSRFEQKQVDQTKPSWLYGKVLTNYLEDEVYYI